jgi:hypothetical protein
MLAKQGPHAEWRPVPPSLRCSTGATTAQARGLPFRAALIAAGQRPATG